MASISNPELNASKKFFAIEDDNDRLGVEDNYQDTFLKRNGKVTGIQT